MFLCVCIYCANLHTMRMHMFSVCVKDERRSQLERISSIKKCLLFSKCEQKSYKNIFSHTYYTILYYYTLAHHSLFRRQLLRFFGFIYVAIGAAIHYCHRYGFHDLRATLSSQAFLLNSNDLLNLSKHKRRAIYID